MASIDSRIAKDPNLRAKYLANPGLRSRLSDATLQKYSPQYFEVRRRNRVNKNLGDTSRSLTGESMTEAAQTLVDSEYKPLYQDLDRQEGKVKERQDRQSGFSASYYKDLAGLADKVLATQRTANTGAVGASAAAGDQSRAAISQAMDEAESRQKAATGLSPELMGGSIEALAAERATNVGRSTENSSRQTEELRRQGENFAGLLGVQGVAAKTAGVAAQENIAREASAGLDELASERSRLRQQQRGAYTDTVLGLRSSEADRALARDQLSSEADKAVQDFELAMAKLKSEADIAKLGRQLQKRLVSLGEDRDLAKIKAQEVVDRETQRRDQAFKSRENAKDRAAGVGKSGSSFTPEQKTKFSNNYEQAAQLARAARSAAGKDRGAFVRVVGERSGSALAARIAAGKLYDGIKTGSPQYNKLRVEAKTKWGMAGPDFHRIWKLI